MLDIALELAQHDPVYEDMASKFFEHFVSIVDAMNQLGGGEGLWDEEDGFYYDYLRWVGEWVWLQRVRARVSLVCRSPILLSFEITSVYGRDLGMRVGWS